MTLFGQGRLYDLVLQCLKSGHCCEIRTSNHAASWLVFDCLMSSCNLAGGRKPPGKPQVTVYCLSSAAPLQAWVMFGQFWELLIWAGWRGCGKAPSASLCLLAWGCLGVWCPTVSAGICNVKWHGFIMFHHFFSSASVHRQDLTAWLRNCEMVRLGTAFWTPASFNSPIGAFLLRSWTLAERQGASKSQGILFPHILVWGSCFWLCTPVRPPARPPASARTTLTHTHCHTTLSHTAYSNTYWHTTFFKHNFVTHNFVTYNSFPYILSHTHTTLSHTQLTHTQLFQPQLTHTQLIHTTFSHAHTHNSFTQNFVAHNFVTYNSFPHALSHIQLFHTHTTLSHDNFDTHNRHNPWSGIDFDAHFAWQAWHLVTLALLLR